MQHKFQDVNLINRRRRRTNATILANLLCKIAYKYKKGRWRKRTSKHLDDGPLKATSLFGTIQFKSPFSTYMKSATILVGKLAYCSFNLRASFTIERLRAGRKEPSR
jgi:hypothetical protein